MQKWKFQIHRDGTNFKPGRICCPVCAVLASLGICSCSPPIFLPVDMAGGLKMYLLCIPTWSHRIDLNSCITPNPMFFVTLTRSQNNSKWNDQSAEHCFVYKIFLNELWMIYSQKIPVVLVLTQSFWRKKSTTSASPIMLPNKMIYKGQKLLPRVVLNVDVKSGHVCSHTWSQPRPWWPWHYSP